MGRDIWSSSDPTFCWNQGLISGYAGTCQTESLIFPVNRILSLLYATHSNWFPWFLFFFSIVRWRFPDTLHACCLYPITTYLWRGHFHLIYNYLLESGKLTSTPPKPHFSGLNKPNFFILPSYIKFSNRLGDTSTDLSLVFNLSWTGRSKLDTVFQLWPIKCQVAWNNHIPSSPGCTAAQ